jgi:hypothetical protein
VVAKLPLIPKRARPRVEERLAQLSLTAMRLEMQLEVMEILDYQFRQTPMMRLTVDF